MIFFCSVLFNFNSEIISRSIYIIKNNFRCFLSFLSQSIIFFSMIEFCLFIYFLYIDADFLLKFSIGSFMYLLMYDFYPLCRQEFMNDFFCIVEQKLSIFISCFNCIFTVLMPISKVFKGH